MPHRPRDRTRICAYPWKPVSDPGSLICSRVDQLDSDTALYAVTAPFGILLSTSPNTSGYVLEVDRLITQNVQAMLQYTAS